MTSFLINYDLRGPGQSYTELYQALSDLGAVRVLESAWAVTRSGGDAEGIRAALAPYIDANDALLVVQHSAWSRKGKLLRPMPEY